MGSAKNTVKKKNRALRKFITIVSLIVFSFIIFAGIITGGYLYITKDQRTQEEQGGKNSAGKDPGGSGILDWFGTKNIKTNVAVFGVDEEGMRTDVIFVVTFDSKTKKINLLSIPRDTRVVLHDDMASEIRGRGGYVPSGNVMKINEVHAYAGKQRANEYSTAQLEHLLGIKIDYYVKMNFEGFRSIVDALDGVEMDVPRNMKYTDRAQNLHINLKKGPQKLYGKEAEQLVRFRSYPGGDVDRVEVQQLFMKELLKQALNQKNLLNNAPSLILTLFKYVETDFGVDDAPKYIRYIKDIKAENVTMETLPGEGKYVGNVSYFIHDVDKTIEVVDRLFYNTESEDEQKESVADSKNARIEILNGGALAGLAGTARERLQKEGYTISRIGNFDGERTEATRIIVRKQGEGEDLKTLFQNSIIEVAPAKLGTDIDIQIILGLEEK